MHALIFGCGYLGQRVAARWLADGHRVTAVTRSETRAADFKRRGIEPLIADVTQKDTLHELPAADVVLFAVGYDRDAGPSMRAVYVDGLANVLSSLRGPTRFLYISSTSVYGQSHGECVDEDALCEPVRENGRICLDAEQLVRKHFADESHGSCCILRLAGIYGPGRLIARVEALQAGEPIAGHPEAWLNLIHVDDAATAVCAAAQRGTAGRTYLVCDDRPRRRREYYERLAKLADAPPPRFDDSGESARTPGLNKRCVNKRMHSELGVELAYPDIVSGLPHALGPGGA
jgi:nucleoside-diphosphate-sugar epimerase